MRKTTLFLTLLLLVFLVTGYKDCKKKNEKQSDAIERVAKSLNGSVIITRENRQTTLKGAFAIGKFPLNEQQLELIDAGLQETLDNLKNEGFEVDLVHQSFEIYTPPYACVLSPVQKVPAFLLRADNYDGTEFDVYPAPKIGVIYAAELVLNLGTSTSQPPIPQMYVCPDTIVLKDGVKHGAEHQGLARYPYFTERFPNVKHNDGFAYYNCTSIHIAYGHPLLPRNDRCINEPNVYSASIITSDNLPERELTEQEKQDLKGFDLSGTERIATPLIIRAVR